MDFSEHRLKDWAWRDEYRAKMGAEAYDAFFESLWIRLDQLRVNEYYDIAWQVKPCNRDLFIKICCQYILTHNDFEFSNDYTKIIRRECFIITSVGLRKKKSS